MPTPEWTDKIPSSWVCEFYHIFFIIYSVFAALALIGGVYVFATSKMSLGALFGTIFNIILVFGLAGTQALFFYLMCDRALKPDGNNPSADRPFI